MGIYARPNNSITLRLCGAGGPSTDGAGPCCENSRENMFRERSCYKEYIYSFNNKVMTHNRNFKVCVLFISFRISRRSRTHGRLYEIPVCQRRESVTRRLRNEQFSSVASSEEQWERLGCLLQPLSNVEPSHYATLCDPLAQVS